MLHALTLVTLILWPGVVEDQVVVVKGVPQERCPELVQLAEEDNRLAVCTSRGETEYVSTGRYFMVTGWYRIRVMERANTRTTGSKRREWYYDEVD